MKPKRIEIDQPEIISQEKSETSYNLKIFLKFMDFKILKESPLSTILKIIKIFQIFQKISFLNSNFLKEEI